MEARIQSVAKFNSREIALSFCYGTHKSTIVAFGIDGYYHVMTGRQYAAARKAELVQAGFIR